MLQKFAFKLHAHYKISFSFRPGLMCVHGLYSYLCRVWASASFSGECSL
jgi:hypothetical protein